jgi:heme-degrading monooxygenase HmoA
MIIEIAQFDVKPGMEDAFEAGVKTALPIFRRAKGCRGLQMLHSIEKPSRYRLLLKWDTVENHIIDFRGSNDYQDFRKLVAHCYAIPPEVEHTGDVDIRF